MCYNIRNVLADSVILTFDLKSKTYARYVIVTPSPKFIHPKVIRFGKMTQTGAGEVPVYLV